MYTKFLFMHCATSENIHTHPTAQVIENVSGKVVVKFQNSQEKYELGEVDFLGGSGRGGGETH